MGLSFTWVRENIYAKFEVSVTRSGIMGRDGADGAIPYSLTAIRLHHRVGTLEFAPTDVRI